MYLNAKRTWKKETSTRQVSKKQEHKPFTWSLAQHKYLTRLIFSANTRLNFEAL